MWQQQMKTWNVRVHRNGCTRQLGQVHQTREELARCAAPSKYGISEDDAEEGTLHPGINPADDFDVSPA